MPSKPSSQSEKQYQVLADSVVMTQSPENDAEASSELLFGETLRVIEDGDEWVKGINERDGYSGYIPRMALDDEIFVITHKLSALRSFAFSEPDFKSIPLRILSFNSHLSIMLEDNGYGLLHQGGWVYMDHVRSIDDHRGDIVDNAMMFLNAPYLWGGRTSTGLDCSALVQLCAMHTGHDCPRDTKDQINSVASPIEFEDTTLQRGDLVYFKGHVGMMIDDTRMINATARHMKVCIEPLSDVADAYDGILAVRRLNSA